MEYRVFQWHNVRQCAVGTHSLTIVGCCLGICQSETPFNLTHLRRSALSYANASACTHSTLARVNWIRWNWSKQNWIAKTANTTFRIRRALRTNARWSIARVFGESIFVLELEMLSGMTTSRLCNFFLFNFNFISRYLFSTLEIGRKFASVTLYMRRTLHVYPTIRTLRCGFESTMSHTPNVSFLTCSACYRNARSEQRAAKPSKHHQITIYFQQYNFFEHFNRINNNNKYTKCMRTRRSSR